jgi:hypothetical protein
MISRHLLGHLVDQSEAFRMECTRRL